MEAILQIVADQIHPISKDDILIKFSNLFYKDDVNNYHEKFEELRSFMRVKYSMLDNEFFMSKFLGDLPLELRVEVQKFRQQSLEEVMSVAKLEFHLHMMGSASKAEKEITGGYKLPRCQPSVC